MKDRKEKSMAASFTFWVQSEFSMEEVCGDTKKRRAWGKHRRRPPPPPRRCR